VTKTLRIAVILDRGRIPRWQQLLLGSLAAAPCELAVFSRPAAAAVRWGVGLALLGLHERWDRRRSLGEDDPFELVEVPSTDAAPRPGDHDAFLWLSRAPLPAACPPELTHGVWYLRQGRAGSDHPAPLAAEVASGEGTAVTALWSREAEGDRLLIASVGSCERLSMFRSRIRAYAKAAELPARHVRSLAAGVARPLPTLPSIPAAPVPGLVTAVAMFARIAGRRLAGELTRLLFEARWVIAYRPKAAERPLSLSGRFATVEPPPGRNYADPFPYEAAGHRGILFEDFPQPSGRGEIATVRVDGDGTPSPAEIVLRRDDHLSYPFLLPGEGAPRMIPESRQTRRVELLRADSFPAGWQMERLLMHGLAATDVTLCEHDGRLWLFTTISVDSGPATEELHLFSADSIDGEWERHPLNPVISDVRRARPAGALFEHDGQLFRPAQDCSRVYGWRTVINRVERLDRSGYREVPIGRIEPQGRLTTRTHTYNLSGGLEVLDAMRLVSRLRPLRRRSAQVGFELVPYEDAAPASTGSSPAAER
jgi:hypothetical protein